MFEIQNYYSFLFAILVFQLVPGAGTITILNATARNGIGAGFGAVLGTVVGDFAYMLAAVGGLAALMKANPVVFGALQWVGAAYLCWMGIQLLRSKTLSEPACPEPRRKGWIYFRQAFAVSLTNPKVMLFFVAFFPLFLRADSSFITLAAMMAHITLLSLLYQVVLVLAGNAVANWMRSLPIVRRLATHLAGVALIAFGAKLAASNH